MPGLLKVPYFHDEVLPSFVSRLANANGQPSAGHFCRDLGISYRSLLHGRREALERLDELNFAPIADLERQAVVLGERNHVTMFGERFSMRQIAKNVLRFCPACLVDDDNAADTMPGTRRYRRAQWMVRDYRTCHVHGCAIADDGVIPAYSDVVELLEKIDIEAGPIGAESVSSMRGVEQFIFDRLTGRRGHGALLDEVAMGAALYFARTIGIAALYGRNQLVDRLSGEERAAGTAYGLAALAEGKDRVFEVLSEITASAERTATGLSRYGRLSYTLFNRSIGAEYDRVCSLISEHNAYETTLIQSELRRRSTSLSMGDLVRTTGLSLYLVRKRLERSGFAPSPGANFDRGAIAILEKESERYLTLKQARDILRCSPDLLREFIRVGLVRAAIPLHIAEGGRHDTRIRMYVDRGELDALMKRLSTRCTRDITPAMSSIRQSAKKSCVRQAELLGDVLEGRIDAGRASIEAPLVDRIYIVADPQTRIFAVS